MRALALALALAAASPALAAPQRCAHITAGVVDNVVIADPASGFAGVDCSNPAAQIGWTFAAGVYHAVTLPVSPQTTALTFLQFMALFTAAEQAAIVNSTDPQVKLFDLMAAGAPQIDMPDPRVIAGVQYLVAVGLVTPARAATILSGSLPP